MAKVVNDNIVKIQGKSDGGLLDRQKVFDFLTEAGESGWELVSTISGKTSSTYKLVFKRLIE